jgi:hypothetical protein
MVVRNRLEKIVAKRAVIRTSVCEGPRAPTAGCVRSWYQDLVVERVVKLVSHEDAAAFSLFVREERTRWRLVALVSVSPFLKKNYDEQNPIQCG